MLTVSLKRDRVHGRMKDVSDKAGRVTDVRVERIWSGGRLLEAAIAIAIDI